MDIAQRAVEIVVERSKAYLDQQRQLQTEANKPDRAAKRQQRADFLHVMAIDDPEQYVQASQQFQDVHGQDVWDKELAAHVARGTGG